MKSCGNFSLFQVKDQPNVQSYVKNLKQDHDISVHGVIGVKCASNAAISIVHFLSSLELKLIYSGPLEILPQAFLRNRSLEFE